MLNSYKLIEGYDPDFFWVDEYASRVIIDRSRNYLYCPIPKCANTAIKHAILNKSTYCNVHDHKFEVLSDLSEDERSSYIAGALKFVVVRDPYDRILSAYLNKFAIGPGCQGDDMPDLWKRFSRFIVRYSRPEGVDAQIAYWPSFSEFVKFVCDLPLEAMNEHWHPQTELAMRKLINYDYVIQFEKINHEWPKLANLLGFGLLPSPESIYFLPTFANSYVDKYYTDELRELIANKFITDFNSFGYSM